jgi:uncharacterized protein YbjT (DUF2867 family)
MTDSRPILVAPASGKTGRRVADRLEARGVPVRRGGRFTAPPFDWELPETWPLALDGVRAAYLAYVPDLAVPGADRAAAAAARCAAQAGVERLVLLSGRGEPGAAAAARAVAATGIPLTVLRCSWFAQNFTEAFLRDGVLAGEIALPAGDVPEPFVDLDDVADAAVAALLDSRHAGATYELTGPEALTFAEVARILGEVSGREIAFRPLTIGQFRDALAGEGAPPDVIWLMTHLFTEVLDGRNARPQDGVRELLGRRPRAFAGFAAAAAAAGAWSQTAGRAA